MKANTVLVVDDDQLVRTHVSTLLSKEGYEVTQAADAREALNVLEHTPFDVVLADYYMPGSTGGDLLRNVRSRANTVPFIVLTASDELDIAVEVLKAGADDFLLKPVQGDVLKRRVENVIKLARTKEMERKLEVERELVELEKRQLVSWRRLYATKETTQTSRFLAMLARTINQSGGFLWVELLEDQLKEDKATYELPKEILEMIAEAGKNQKEIFDYVTLVSTAESFELDIEDQSVADLWEELRTLAQDHFATICPDRSTSVLGPAEFPEATIAVDVVHLKQVIEEVINNAAKYSPAGTRIVMDATIEPDAGGDRLVITVDNHAKMAARAEQGGDPIVGVPYDYRERVFDLFYTLDDFPTHIDGERWRFGTGLYLCRRIIREMQGWIEISTGLDRTGGTTEPMVRVTIRIPLKEAVS